MKPLKHTYVENAERYLASPSHTLFYIPGDAEEIEIIVKTPEEYIHHILKPVFEYTPTLGAFTIQPDDIEGVQK